MMPLNVLTLTEAILRLTDARRGDFAGWPLVPAQVAANWANACATFFAESVVPPPTEPALSAATTAFRAAMTTGLAGGPAAGVAALDAGFLAFAVAWAAAAAAVGLIAAPPAAGAPGVAGAFSGPVADPVLPAGRLASIVYAWAVTGTATVPPAPPVPWS